MKIFNYSSVTLNGLAEFFNIQKIQNRTVFNTWFNKKYPFSQNEKTFLKKLIIKNIDYINDYTELELVTKFIGPILNKVDFEIKDKHIRDWYEVSLKYKTKKYYFKGRCDFMVAKGYDKPMIPYFFIQEFKPSSATYPEYQLLSEMLVATLLHNNKTIKGAFIVGSTWVFMILEPFNKNKYKYYLSKKYDAIEIDDLQQIYQNLQSIKSEISSWD